MILQDIILGDAEFFDHAIEHPLFRDMRQADRVQR